MLEADAHEEEGTSEAEATWRFGASMLGEYLVPSLLGNLFTHNHGAHDDSSSMTNNQAAPEEAEKNEEQDNVGDEKEIGAFSCVVYHLGSGHSCPILVTVDWLHLYPTFDL
mmetsp:Transcript_20352/g.47118  ORF Transcript_20352/g.47118 Transcript_20352/m.47118 type:complete len:111 (+) Transcript_20352:394-726(+)